MTTTEEMQKLIILGAIAQQGEEEQFNQLLSEFREKEKNLTEEKDKAVFLLAISFYGLELSKILQAP